MLENFKTMKQAELEINPPKEYKSKKCSCNAYESSCKTSLLTKQLSYNHIRLLVNTTSNDMLLGEAVRKLFS